MASLEAFIKALKRLDPLARQLQLGDVGEGDHHAGDDVLAGAVGHGAAQETIAVRTRALVLQLKQRVQHLACIVDQRVDVHLAGDVGQRAVQIGGNQLEQKGRRQRVALDVQLGIQEQRRNVGAGEQIAQVVVDRFEFFLRSGQLFVGRLQLLVGGLELLDRDAQLTPNAAQRVLQRLDCAVAVAVAIAAVARGCARSVRPLHRRRRLCRIRRQLAIFASAVWLSVALTRRHRRSLMRARLRPLAWRASARG
ncbi:MAG: hypothetical protein ABIR94_09955 [Rubrivivax sp.]